MNENRKLYDSLILAVASRLHHFDFKGDRTNESFESLQERLSDDAVAKRYRNDAVFHAKVTSMTAAISEITIKEITTLREKLRVAEEALKINVKLGFGTDCEMYAKEALAKIREE